MLLFVPVVSLTHTPIGREHSTVQGFSPRLAPIHLRHGRSSLQQRQACGSVEHPPDRRQAGRGKCSSIRISPAGTPPGTCAVMWRRGATGQTRLRSAGAKPN